MIARMACLFSRDNASPAVAGTPSWMLLTGPGSDANRTCIAEQSLKGIQRG
jgi:hypothetical protein